jgi:hypothetical protein
VPGAFLFTEAARYEPAASERFPGGAVLRLVRDGQVRALVPQFAASADGAVSFDGTRVLFSGRQYIGDRWQIWEVDVSGGTPRRVTAFPEDTIAPLYVTPERIVCSRRTRDGFQLEIVAIEGKYSQRLTYAPGDHIATDVLRDGRILFVGPHPAAPAGRDLYTVYSDGSGVETYRCDHSRDRYAGVELSSGDIVFPSGASLGRFTSARAVQVDVQSPTGQFAGRIAEIAPGDWLAAFRPNSASDFGLYRWARGRTAAETVWATAGRQAVDPVFLRRHDIPKRHPSSLGDRDGANLLALNVYTSRLPIAAGAVARVRVWELDEAAGRISLGEALVESDGSFFVQTPSERPIQFELLDRAGKTVAAEKGWFWARRGEQRVCVGCHAGPERAPENRAPAILGHSTEPARMTARRDTAVQGVSK